MNSDHFTMVEPSDKLSETEMKAFLRSDTINAIIKDSKSPDFSKMLNSMLKAFKSILKNPSAGYDYKGPDLRTNKLLVVCNTIKVSLTPEMLKYDKEEQNRSELEVLVGCAIRLGIQKGLDMAAEESLKEYRDLLSSCELIQLLSRVEDPIVKEATIMKEIKSLQDRLEYNAGLCVQKMTGDNLKNSVKKHQTEK